MDQRSDDLQQNIEATRQDIEDTRAAMTEKLGLLEERVRETLEDTKSAVEDIVGNVRDTVGETVETVRETVGGAKATVDTIVENVKGTMDDTVKVMKQSFDLHYQVEQRPWLMFSGSILAGWVLGSMAQGRPSRYWDDEYQNRDANNAFMSGAISGTAPYSGQKGTGQSEDAFWSAPEATASRREHFWSGLGQFQEEWDAIKGAIIGTLMGTVREMVKQNMPSVAPQLEKAIDSATKKMGAEPVHSGPDGHNGHAQEHSQHGTEHQSQPRQNPSPSAGQPLRPTTV